VEAGYPGGFVATHWTLNLQYRRLNIEEHKREENLGMLKQNKRATETNLELSISGRRPEALKDPSRINDDELELALLLLEGAMDLLARKNAGDGNPGLAQQAQSEPRGPD
jgi:hypothetical protein